MTYDIAIIGAGPSGMTAALYSLRAGKSVLLLEKETIGGQISSSPLLENYPSINKISGLEFSNNLFQQIIDLGVAFELDEVIDIEKDNDEFNIKCQFSCYKSKSIILATGVKHRHINVENEEKLIGHGVSYCAVCDGAFYKNEDVCIIGDANTALQYAILLSNYCNKVYLNTLFDRFFGDNILIERVKERNNIIIEHNLSLTKLKENNGELQGLVFKNTKTKELKEFVVKGCFIAIGQIPDNKKFSNLVSLNNDGFIITNEKMETLTPGVYACGDCKEKQVRQVVTAINDGAIASIYACQYLDSLK